MIRPSRALLVGSALVLVSTAVRAQDTTASPARRNSGPRVGVTVLTPALKDRLEREFSRNTVFPVLTVFGWHSELDVATNANGAAAVVQGVVAVAGAEQGMFLPSATM